MKTRAIPNEEVDRIKSFIRKSCLNCDGKNSRHYNFHKKLVEHYFDARNVNIFYEEKKVTAEIAVGNNNYTTINFGCLDISTFLSSCIRENQESFRIYYNYMREEESASSHQVPSLVSEVT